MKGRLSAGQHVLLVRHGETTWATQRRVQGWGDPPLSVRGREQAAASIGRLRSAGIRALACSDLARARETAEVIGARLDVQSVLQVEGLRERDLGAWTGLTRTEIGERWPSGEAPANAEELGAFRDRVLATMAALAEELDTPALVVAHRGVLRVCETEAGCEASDRGFLCGRWFEWQAGTLVAGPLFGTGNTLAGSPAATGGGER